MATPANSPSNKVSALPLNAKGRARRASGATRRANATQKSGNPQADRAARSTRAKAQAAKATPKAAPKRAPRAKVSYPAVKVPAGYLDKYDHGAWTIFKKIDKDLDGPAWLVYCKPHGTTQAAQTRQDRLGFGARRATWCAGCKKDAAAK